MASYFKCKKLGEGTYAVIYLAKRVPEREVRLIKTDPGACDDYVAIKKIKKSAYGLGQEISAIREVRTLRAIKSEYVVRMEDIFLHKGTIHLVLEYVMTDLEQILKSRSLIIMPGDIKAWMHMLLSGLFECHRRNIVHRDVKPNNLLITADGTLKLADFGLSRRFGNKMTAQAITRWYRAPEVLLGAGAYGPAVDMWAVGAVFAEMFLRVPLFAGDSDIAQLNLIFRALGTPSVRDWPLITELPAFTEFKRIPAQPLGVLFSAASEDAIDLLRSLLVYNPLRRIGCHSALCHPYFSHRPYATPIGSLPVPKPSM